MYGYKYFCLLFLIFLSLFSSAEDIRYYHTDFNGSPLAITNEQGEVIWRGDYKPFGESTNPDGMAAPKTAFLGKERISGFNVNYLMDRFYDPSLMRFLSIDPVDVQTENLHSFNRYIYGNNHPYKYQDPTGNYAEAVIEIASISMGVYSLSNNLQSGNYWDASVDATGIVADTFLMAIPIAPGATGIAIQASREGSEQVIKNSDSLVPAGQTVADTSSAVTSNGDTYVYLSVDFGTGQVQYVGITNDLVRRSAEHLSQKGIAITAVPGLGPLTRSDARDVEQVLIDLYGLDKNGGTLKFNKINSISPLRSDYQDRYNNGLNILQTLPSPVSFTNNPWSPK